MHFLDCFVFFHLLPRHFVSGKAFCFWKGDMEAHYFAHRLTRYYRCNQCCDFCLGSTAKKQSCFEHWSPDPESTMEMHDFNFGCKWPLTMGVCSWLWQKPQAFWPSSYCASWYIPRHHPIMRNWRFGWWHTCQVLWDARFFRQHDSFPDESTCTCVGSRSRFGPLHWNLDFAKAW